MDNVTASNTKDTSHCIMPKCQRVYLVPIGGSHEICPTCERLIRLGLEEAPVLEVCHA